MRAFEYVRPASLAEAIALLDRHGPGARPLAGGTDLVIRLRDGSIRPDVVFDVKAIPELDAGISRRRRPPRHRRAGGDDRHRRRPARPPPLPGAGGGGPGRRLGPDPEPRDAGRQPVQRLARRRHGARPARLRRGARGRRRRRHAPHPRRRPVGPLRRDDPGPGRAPDRDRAPGARRAARLHARPPDAAPGPRPGLGHPGLLDRAGRGRRASPTAASGRGPLLAVDDSGVLADPDATETARADVLDRLLAGAAPSPTSMRASPEYRLAMLRVLGRRAILESARRLAADGAA